MRRCVQTFTEALCRKDANSALLAPTHTQTEYVHIEPSSLAHAHSHTSLPCGALERRGALLTRTMEGLDWPLQRRSRSGRAAVSFAERLEVSPGVSSRLTPQCLRRTRPPLWARLPHHFTEERREGGKLERSWVGPGRT